MQTIHWPQDGHRHACCIHTCIRALTISRSRTSSISFNPDVRVCKGWRVSVYLWGEVISLQQCVHVSKPAHTFAYRFAYICKTRFCTHGHFLLFCSSFIQPISLTWAQLISVLHNWPITQVLKVSAGHWNESRGILAAGVLISQGCWLNCPYFWFIFSITIWQRK